MTLNIKLGQSIVIGLIIKLANCHEGHQHEEIHIGGAGKEWADAHHLSLKVNQGVDFKWLSKDDEYVTMGMSSFTGGYVSVGFCKNWKGTMEGCDIVVGWVSNLNGTAYLFDYFARGNTLPEVDMSQDYELLEGSQEFGITTIKFRRKWDTGDEYYDVNLKDHKVRIIWAWHPEDPLSSNSFFKHAGNSRGHLLQDISLKHPSNTKYSQEGLYSSGHSSRIFSTSQQFMGALMIVLMYIIL